MKNLEMITKEFSDLLVKSIFADQSGKVLSSSDGFDFGLKAFEKVQKDSKCIYVIGNGGSAAVASHVVTDLVNTAGLNASTIHEPAVLTCFTNDYGYEEAFKRMLCRKAKMGDLLIAVSSSGKSKNILNAVTSMRELGGTVITLSGFKTDNPLRGVGDLNIWIDSEDFGHVEVGHLFLLHHMAFAYKERVKS